MAATSSAAQARRAQDFAAGDISSVTVDSSIVGGAGQGSGIRADDSAPGGENIGR